MTDVGRFVKRGHDEALDALIEESIAHRTNGAITRYLGQYGDAIDTRVTAALEQAGRLLTHSEPGPALVCAVTAVELMIRFLVLRPLMQGAFLSDEWAEILTTRVATGRTSEDRELVATVAEQFGINVIEVTTPSGARMWETLLRAWKHRDDVVHRYEPVDPALATAAIECATAFRHRVVGAIAAKLGFTLESTGRWSEIAGSMPVSFTPADPLTRHRPASPTSSPKP